MYGTQVWWFLSRLNPRRRSDVTNINVVCFSKLESCEIEHFLILKKLNLFQLFKALFIVADNMSEYGEAKPDTPKDDKEETDKEKSDKVDPNYSYDPDGVLVYTHPETKKVLMTFWFISSSTSQLKSLACHIQHKCKVFLSMIDT